MGRVCKWVVRWDAERRKMSQVAGKDDEPVVLGGRSNHDIREAGRVTLAASEIRQGTSETGGCDIKRQDAGSIEVQYRFEPCAQVSGFASGAFSFGLGDTVLDFRDGHNREE